MIRSHIVGCGAYLPGNPVSNEELAARVDTTDEWIRQRTGITQRYLAAEYATEADWRLFVTMIRFDFVYFSHFKCNIRRIQDYPNLWNHTLELYQTPGVAEVVDIPGIKKGYYGGQSQVNPTGIVPVGPAIDLTVPHNRGQVARAA